MSSTDASASLQGYLYQKLVAMYLACRFLIQNPYFDDNELKKRYLSIEIDGDDVVICKGVLATDGKTFNTKDEIHLFQTKFYGKDTMSEHYKAILQLYLNQEYHKTKYPTANTYTSFVTKTKIKHSSAELGLGGIMKLLNTTYKSKKQLPKSSDPKDSKGNYIITHFPRPEYQDLIGNFPNFNNDSYTLSDIIGNVFQNLSIGEVESYLQSNISILNSDFIGGHEQIKTLYLRLTQKIFAGKHISLYEIKNIFSQPLTETLDELISSGSNEWKFQLKKDQFLRKIGDLFDIEDILNEINSTITYNYDDITNLASERFDDLNKYINGLEEDDFNDFLYKVTLKNITPITNQQSFIDFGSKNIPEDIVGKWLKTYLHCYMRCEQKSFDEIFLITGIDTQNIKNIINQSLYTLYHYPQRVIGSYGHNYSKNGTIVDFTKEDLEKAGIKAIRYIKQSQGITKPYEVCLCCMEHICDSGLNNKFREQEKCSHCKTKFNFLS